MDDIPANKEDSVEGFVLDDDPDAIAIPHGMIPKFAHYSQGRMLVHVGNWTAKAEYDQDVFDVYSLVEAAEKRLGGAVNTEDPSDKQSDWWHFKPDAKPNRQALRQNGEFVSVRSAG